MVERLVTINHSLELNENDQRQCAITIAQWTEVANAQGEAILRQNPNRLYDQMASGLSFVAFNEINEPVAHVTVYHLGSDSNEKDWYEVGTLFVEPNSRGLKIGNALCEALANFLPDAYLVPTTKNPAAVAAFLHAGFEIVSFHDIPENIRDGLCYTAPCYTPVEKSASCTQEHNLAGKCFALARKPQE